MKKLYSVVSAFVLCLLCQQSFAGSFFNEIYRASSIGINRPHHGHGIGVSSSSSSCSLSVTISPLNPSICSGSSVTLTAIVTDNSSSTFSYTWSTSGIYDTINADPLTSTSYSVIVYDGVGCSSSAASFITVNSTPTVTVSPQTICSGNSTTLTATVTDPSSSIYNYTWNTGGTHDTIDVNPISSSTYTVTVLDGNSCSATAIGSVIVISSPTVTVSPQSICSGNMATLTATVTPPSSAYTYSWNTGGTNDTIDVNPGTNATYSVSVSEGGGCSATASAMVTVNALPTVTFATISFSDTICQTSTPYPISGGSPSGGTYSGTNVLSGFFIPSSSGNFIILYTYTDSLGCSDTASHLVVVESCLTGANSVSPSSGYEIYPNPASNSLDIKFNNLIEGKPAQISITDITGRVVSESVKTVGNDLIIPLDVSEISSGMYFLRVTAGGVTQITKFVKQ